MNAAELDTYLVAEDAYNSALDAGRTEDEALVIARAAARENQARQTLRRVGLTEAEITQAITQEDT